MCSTFLLERALEEGSSLIATFAPRSPWPTFFHSALVFAASESSGKKSSNFPSIWARTSAVDHDLLSSVVSLFCRWQLVGTRRWQISIRTSLSSIYGFRLLPRNIILGSLQTARRLLLVFMGQKCFANGKQTGYRLATVAPSF